MVNEIEVKKEKFITVMAIFDDDTQKKLQSIQDDTEQQYGEDTKTKGIPYHISLGSYPVEKTDEIVSRIINVTNKSKRFADKVENLTNAEIVGIELGEFFPPKNIIRVLFDCFCLKPRI